MLKKIVIALVAVVALFAAFVATRPDAFRIERSVVIDAAPGEIVARISDFTHWREWSPWDKLDPTVKRSFGGTPGTVGHTYSWSGNTKVGEGRMTLSELAPGERVAIRLDFFKPFEATNLTTFSVLPGGSGSRVTWAMTGTNGFVMKAIGIVMNMDRVVGGDFDRGLQALKSVTEAEARRSAAIAPAMTH